MENKYQSATQIILELKRTLAAFKAPNEVFEIRFLNTPRGIISGYYYNSNTSIDKLMADITRLSLWQYTIYMTINPVNDECMERSNQKLGVYAKKTTKDSEISVIRWLHIDLDPKRPAKIQATETETQFAKQKMIDISTYLKGREIIDPILSFSGNGYNLDYRINLPNTAENVSKVKSTLNKLAEKFSDEHVDVDTTTYNPSRIVKCYGCISKKGENTADRPYRYSRILSIPQDTVINDISDLAGFSGEDASDDTEKSEFNVEDWLGHYGLTYSKKPGDNGAEIYVFDVCPWNSEHTNHSAFLIRFPNGRMIAKCLHNSCQGNDLDSLMKRYPPVGLPKVASQKHTGSVSDTLLNLARNNMRFFMDNQNNAYVLYNNGKINSLSRTNSGDTEVYLRKLYYDSFHKSLDKNCLRQVVDTLVMFGKTSEEVHDVHQRIAFQNDSLFYDLSDEFGSVVQVDKYGSKIVKQNQAVYFIRTSDMKTQVKPNLQADPTNIMEYIHKYFRIADDKEAVLFTVYLVACFLEQISHPILILHGEKGSAKSTTMRMIQRIVSPSMTELLPLPKSRDDLAVILNQHYFVAFDNLQVLNTEKSDLLCQASTGGVYVKRRLYTDNEDVALPIKNCVACNGINVVASKSDLLDRSILIQLQRIPEKERRTDLSIQNEFEKDLPSILGCCLNAVSKALNCINEINLERLPRMADFAKWGYAIAIGIDIDPQIFFDAYMDNICQAKKESINTNSLAECIIQFMQQNSSDIWKGTWSKLYKAVKDTAFQESITLDRFFPKAPSALSRRINEIKTDLESIGLFISVGYDHTNKVVTIIKQKFDGEGGSKIDCPK